MEEVRDIFDITLNYWVVHPQHKEEPSFKQFIEENEGDLEGTSVLMWYLKYVYHPKSTFSIQPLHIRKTKIAKSIIGDETFLENAKEWLPVLVQAYQDIVETVLDRSIRAMQDTLDAKIQFLASDLINYDVDSFEAIDKMTANLEKQNEVLDKLRERKEKSLANSTSEGGQELSESDKGMM